MVWRHLSRRLNSEHSTQIPLFKYDTKGQALACKNILPRRNYCIVDYDEDSMSLVFDIRAEKVKGVGTTVRYVNNLVSSNPTHECPSYPVSAPPPMWRS